MVKSPPLLASLRQVSKSFSTGGVNTPALRGVDLDVAAGELLMLVGPSGCGKTTLISVLAGILTPDAGDVCVLGEHFTTLSPARLTALRGAQLGFVFQAYNLIPSLTACENVSIPALLNGIPRRTAMARAAVLLERVGLGDRRDHLPTQLSGGQQQRVAIARSLIHAPRLIVCDEPTSALDHHTGEQVMALLREVALTDGRALVVVTHDSRIFPYADRIAHMDDGRIINIEPRSAA